MGNIGKAEAEIIVICLKYNSTFIGKTKYSSQNGKCESHCKNIMAKTFKYWNSALKK